MRVLVWSSLDGWAAACDSAPRTHSIRPRSAMLWHREHFRLVGSLKGVSARLLRTEYPEYIRRYLWGEHFWSPSYFAASTGGATSRCGSSR